MDVTPNITNTTDMFDTPTWIYATVDGQYPYMSEQGGGASAAIIAGAGIGGCALVVGLIAMVIYCYMKARKEKAKPNMTKSQDVFSTAASNTQFDLPRKSRVNQYPDPTARRRERDNGHVNPAYTRHGSDTSSVGSDVEGRDLSPPRVRRPRDGNFSSLSSDDSSSVEDDVIPGNSFKMEREIEDRDRRGRSSYKRSRQNDLLDSDRTNTGRYRRTDEESQRMSRRDEFTRNPRSDSPLTIGSLRKHEEITGSDKHDDNKSSKSRSRRRDPSPSSRTYESSEVTQMSLTTEGTMTTQSSGTRFQKNPSLRRNSPSRSSSHRRYRKDNEKDANGRRKPRRTRSSDRGDHTDSARRERSRSPGGSSQRSSSSRGSSRRSRSAAKAEAKQANREQAILPIFQQTKSKKSSAV